MKTAAKTGRKQKPHRDSQTGEYVQGLTRDRDGRWRIIGTQIRWTEPDEQKAIERFKAMAVPKVVPWDQPRAKPFTKLERLQAEWDELDPEEIKIVPFHFFAKFFLDPACENPRHPLWKFFAVQIAQRPRWIAEATGVEWIAYGPKLDPPEPLPSFKTLEDNWTTYTTTSGATRRQTLKDWQYFVNTTDIQAIDGITEQVVVDFRDNVIARNLSPKRQQHLFGNVRRMLSFNSGRAVAREAIAKALFNLKLLKPNGETTSLDPMPISVADWKALLGKAQGDDKAMILLMLNCALYLQEVVNLTWENIQDGCLIAHRKKKGKFLRVAVLWAETIEALKAMERKGDSIFYSLSGLPLTVSGAGKRFRKLRKAAGEALTPKREITVEANQLRDGAATAAAEANVNSELINLLLGHRSGMKDHYVKRNPQMVKPATDAVHAKYFA